MTITGSLKWHCIRMLRRTTQKIWNDLSQKVELSQASAGMHVQGRRTLRTCHMTDIPYVFIRDQGRRQEFATGDKRGGLGTEVPSWVQGQSPGGSLGTKPREAGDKC